MWIKNISRHHYSHCSSLRCPLEGTVHLALRSQRWRLREEMLLLTTLPYCLCFMQMSVLKFLHLTRSFSNSCPPPQTRHQHPNHAEQHAGRVGEDELQLAGPGSLPLDPRGPSPLPRQGFQLNTSPLRTVFSCLCHMYSIVWLLTLHRRYYGFYKVRFHVFAFVLLCLFYCHGADLSVSPFADIGSVREFFICLIYAGFWQ